MKEVVRVTRPAPAPDTRRTRRSRTRPATWPSCSWRASTTAPGRTATPSTITGRSSAGSRSGWRRCSSPPGPTTASASTSRRWEISSPCRSPFFRDEYFPEALILKAVIYYENCRYAESTAIVQEFERRYKPVYDALDDLTQKNMEAADYYAVLADIQKKNRTAKKTGQSSGPDPRAGAEARPERQGPQEHQRLDHRAGERARRWTKTHPSLNNTDLAKHLQDILKKQRTALIQKAGLMAKAKLE